ncbi:MAG: hypothetical protein AB7G21_06490 [Dehalococcoidia bacterium]
METAHRLPRFFVAWWTLATVLGLLVFPVGSVVIGGRGLESPPLVLAGAGVAGFLSSLLFLGPAQAITLRSFGARVSIGRWIGWTLGGWIVGYLAGLLLGTLVFVTALIGATRLFPDLFLVTWFVAIALAGGIGGGLFGLSLTTFQAFEFAGVTNNGLWRWRLGGVLGWAPFGAVYGMDLSYSAMVGLHDDVVPAWGVVLAVLLFVVAFASPGLVTGLALKRIVEA